MTMRGMSQTSADAAAVGLAEYDALQGGAVTVPHDAVWKSFSGPKAVDVLNGLVTNDVSSLQAGEAGIAVALTPKGKVVADLLIVRAGAERFLVGASAASAGAWHDLVRKYVNPRLAAVSDEGSRLRSTLVVGPSAPEVASAVAVAVAAASTSGADGGETLVARVLLQAPTPFWIVMTPLEEGGRLTDLVAAAGAVQGSEALGALARVEAGWPAVGFGMDENTIPQEANLDALGAISFTKGCYTGQETVVRIHFRGHVNRHLRGLRSEHPLVIGAAIVDTAGKAIGDVRATAHSPRYGSIALAMIRREVGNDDRVLVQVDGSDVPATVVILPFR